ncbi:unnamed protein product [Peronospora farinosa]|uniref:WRKY19-like zinc finger domain-containing protein n=1 Tax=Peronospora farinosa TaxID=134698 RepID=A0AAV0T6U2_9STRA|nr:unnamed protein product [Peronospora farinosa]
MLDTTSYGSKPLQHDAETFQVAKELILLSHRPSSDNVMNITMNNNSPSTISDFFKHDIINSRCDISHLELLKEHRVRFRRVRRRWNVEQRTKKQQYLARFHVQGIPLMHILRHLVTDSSVPSTPKHKNEERKHLKRQGLGNTTAQNQQKDTTALEIAANEALFGQTGSGADDPWVMGLSSTSGTPWGASDPAASNWFSVTGDFTRGGGNHNPRSGKCRGNIVQMPQATGASHHLPNRMKNSLTNGNNAISTPYFHHFLDRNSNNNATNSLLLNPEIMSSSTYTTTKRPRATTTNNSSFLSPFVVYPPPPFEPDRFLPDYNANWGLISRNGTRNNTNWTSSNALIPNINSTTSNGTGIGSPNGTSTIMDSFLPDYDSTLYSLWSAPGGSSVMGYETDTEAAPSQQQPVQPPLYLVSDDELKMDSSYPQLPEFNQDLDSYLNDTIESGGPSPTTPLGTSIANSGIKMDQLVTTDRRLNSRESQLEMLLAPTTTAESLVKRERATLGLESWTGRSTNRFRGGHNKAYTLANTTDTMVEAVSSGITNSLRTISRNSTMETKQRVTVMPSLASYQSGPMSNSSKSQMEGSSIGTVTLTTIVTSPSSSTSDVKNGKRPRSRQCEFPGCQNRARSHQKCKKHGGAHQCVFEGCTKNSQSRGLCIAHGGGSRCKKEGCVRAAQSKGLCKSHGGGEYCAVDGCNKKAHLKHLCRTHGGGVRCKLEKCSKWAQRKGWCMAHAKEFAAP